MKKPFLNLSNNIIIPEEIMKEIKGNKEQKNVFSPLAKHNDLITLENKKKNSKTNYK